MPGTETNTIGDYSAGEIAAMGADDFKAAQARGFKREAEPVADDRPAAAGLSLGSAVPKDVTQPSGNVWASKKVATEDFTCPSGQTCRLRAVKPEELLAAGILDRVTRLEGLAGELVDQAEGQPPAKAKMPSQEDFALLLDTINMVVPMAVAEPRVYRDDDSDAPDDAIRVSDLDLEDRMAIMEKSLSKIKMMDNFRHPR